MNHNEEEILIKKILDTGLFDWHDTNYLIFFLKETQYNFIITRAGTKIWRQREKLTYPFYDGDSFQLIFELVPLYIKEKLIYHMDLFCV